MAAIERKKSLIQKPFLSLPRDLKEGKPTVVDSFALLKIHSSENALQFYVWALKQKKRKRKLSETKLLLSMISTYLAKTEVRRSYELYIDANLSKY